MLVIKFVKTCERTKGPDLPTSPEAFSSDVDRAKHSCMYVIDFITNLMAGATSTGEAALRSYAEQPAGYPIRYHYKAALCQADPAR